MSEKDNKTVAEVLSRIPTDDLLAACRGLVSLVERIDRCTPPDDDTWLRAEEYEAGRAAIAKATETKWAGDPVVCKLAEALLEAKDALEFYGQVPGRVLWSMSTSVLEDVIARANDALAGVGLDTEAIKDHHHRRRRDT